jgi:hypothetical protein
MIDFNHRSKSDAINFFIDSALENRNRKEANRDYLGGSVLGYECERQLQYRFMNVPKDKDFTGKSLKIFETGHVLEDLIASWLKLAGFDLETEYRFGPKVGQQVGFKALDGKISGHRDGKLISGPDIIKYPCLWECKSMAAKYWRICKEKGVMVSNPEYYGQIQVYMPYFELTDNPAVFTAINKDTQELLHECVDFSPAIAQSLSDKGFKVIMACERGVMLPRISESPDWYKCRWCDWHATCFGD